MLSGDVDNMGHNADNLSTEVGLMSKGNAIVERSTHFGRKHKSPSTDESSTQEAKHGLSTDTKKVIKKICIFRRYLLKDYRIPEDISGENGYNYFIRRKSRRNQEYQNL